MKFNFEPKLNYQIDSINSIVNIFKGINTDSSNFSLSCNKQFSLINNSGIKNQILNENWIEIANKNLKEIQEKNYLDITRIKKDDPVFDLEMETGTGKTYVFLRTILELNKQYNFTKFIIVVPSIAIKEGVKKTLNITKEHFSNIYNNIPYKYFEYDPKSINKIYDFATNNNIEIMIINIQSFNKQDNIINNDMDQLNGKSPIDLIKQTNPIVIIDEPQTTANTEASIKSINKLNPLFKIRYSATFRTRKHESLVYKLSPVDAYKQNLVKRIIVYGQEKKWIYQ